MRRTLPVNGFILAVAAAFALVLSVARPSPEGLIDISVGEREVRAAPGAPTSSVRAKHNLTALKIFNLTLVRVRDSYVEPERIDPKKMLFAALDSVQFNIPEVLVEPHPERDEVVVIVNDKQEIFSTSDVDSPWRLSGKLKKIFRFIEANMNPGADLAQVEYAAVNGMLHTLDPHSMLLDPEGAEELDAQTSGKFGGLGIVIGMRKGKLTVLQPMAGTPASRAGVKACDHIVRINTEPTENLTTTEAANRMRGDPQTKVTIFIKRKGQDNLLQFDLVRDQIRVPSVEYRMLQNNVGYMKVKQFASRSATEVKNAMDELREKGATSWILDLRWNPGGLFEPAVQMADLFVDSGTIVTQVGGKEREPRRATRSGSDTTTPLVVLVNGGSASASEIVSGALKNLDRAAIIGTTTFGKGSVQLVYDNNDGSKLKLTISQYLTPGDVSIQSLGITPDVELVRMLVPKELKSPADQVRLLATAHTFREKDYEIHLTSKNAREGARPFDSVRYLYEPPTDADVQDACAIDDEAAEPGPGLADEEDEGPIDTDGFIEDYEIKFARDFVAQAHTAGRKAMLDASRKFIAARRAAEQKKLAAALAVLGVDWSTWVRKEAGKPQLTTTVTVDKPHGVVKAGEGVSITGTVSNQGAAPAYQVYAQIKSDDRVFDETELVFGKIDPGQSKSFTTQVKVPMDAVDRVDVLDFDLKDGTGAATPVEPIKLTIAALDHPVFAYAHQLIDEGNGDGLLQTGESHRLRVTIKNTGKGEARDVTALLRNASTDADHVVVKKGRFEVGALAAGADKTLDFTFDVTDEFQQDEAILELTVYDSVLRESLVEKLRYPLRAAAAGPQPASGAVQVVHDTDVREGAAADAARIGTAKRGLVLKTTGREGEWVRVELEPGRPGFLAAAAVRRSTRKSETARLEPLWQVTPPVLSLNVPTLETSASTYHLEGRATDETHVEDVYIFVSNRDAKIDGRKVFYRSNRGGKQTTDMSFATDLPLWPGNNLITVVARENDDVRSAHTMYIYKNNGRITAQAPGPPETAEVK